MRQRADGPCDVYYPAQPERALGRPRRAWRAAARGGLCPAAAAGVRGGPSPAGGWRLVPGRGAQRGSQRLLGERRRAWGDASAWTARRQMDGALWDGCQQGSPTTVSASAASPSMASATAGQRPPQAGALPAGGALCLPHEQRRPATRPPARSNRARRFPSRTGRVAPLPALAAPIVAEAASVMSGKC